MNKQSFKLKNKIITTIFLSLIFMFSGIFLLTKTSKVYAENFVEFTGINNTKFTSTSSSKLPSSPSNWTLTVSDIPSNVKAGVISLEDSDFLANNNENYNLNSKPLNYFGLSSEDSKVLMLNARTGQANIGYKSNTFTLNKNSYYSISVWTYTETEKNTYGTMVLSSNGIESTNACTIATFGNWKKYTMLVATNSLISLSDCSLQLWLGSNTGSQDIGASGAIFFDNIETYELSENEFNDRSSQLNANDSVIINLKDEKLSLIEDAGISTNFETDKDGWTFTSKNTIYGENTISGVYNVDDTSSNYVKNVLKIDTAPTTGNFANNHKALFINNLKDAVSVGYESNAFELENNSIYKLSVWTKSKLTSGKAQLVLSEQPFDEENYTDFNKNLKTFTLDVSQSTNKLTNDWIEHSFFITTRTFSPIASADYKCKVKLGLWVGTESEPAIGYSFFDNISICKITTEKANETGSTISKANFMEESSASIKNGGFNSIEINNVENSYPFTPNNWTISSSDQNLTKLLNGVVNTSENNFEKLQNSINEKIAQNKLSSYATNIKNSIVDVNFPDNNVLLIGNLSNNYQYYESEDIALEKNSYYTLSVMVSTNVSNTAKSSIKLLSNNVTIGEITNISTNGLWQTYSFQIKTGNNAVSAKLQLALGSNSKMGTGFTFFDNTSLNKSSEDKFASILANSKKIDLSVEDFTNVSDEKNIYSGLLVPNAWSFNSSEQNVDDVKYGVVDTSINLNYTTPNSTTKNILTIESTNTEGYYNYASKNFYTVEANSYYKLTVWVKTNNVNHSKNEKDSQYGASVLLTSDNAETKGFKGIVTDGEWTKYTMFINSTDKVDYSLVLALGNSKDYVNGSVNFSTIILESIERDAYVDGVASIEKDSTINNIMAIGNTDVKKEEETEDSDKTGFQFDFALVSSIITAVAIIIAVVGVAVRKVKFKKVVKVPTGDYDRNIMIKKVQEHEQKISANDEKLNNLKQQLDLLKLEISEAKLSYKLEIEKIEEDYKTNILTIETSNNNDKETIKSLKKDAKVNKDEIRKQKEIAYNERRKALEEKFHLIEKEIELVYQEELRLINEYKFYKKQVKLKKQERKLNKKSR